MPDDAAYASQSDITGAFHYDIIYNFSAFTLIMLKNPVEYDIMNQHKSFIVVVNDRILNK